MAAQKKRGRKGGRSKGRTSKQPFGQKGQGGMNQGSDMDYGSTDMGYGGMGDMNEEEKRR